MHDNVVTDSLDIKNKGYWKESGVAFFSLLWLLILGYVVFEFEIYSKEYEVINSRLNADPLTHELRTLGVSTIEVSDTCHVEYVYGQDQRFTAKPARPFFFDDCAKFKLQRTDGSYRVRFIVDDTADLKENYKNIHRRIVLALNRIKAHMEIENNRVYWSKQR